MVASLGHKHGLSDKWASLAVLCMKPFYINFCFVYSHFEISLEIAEG